MLSPSAQDSYYIAKGMTAEVDWSAARGASLPPVHYGKVVVSAHASPPVTLVLYRMRRKLANSGAPCPYFMPQDSARPGRFFSICMSSEYNTHEPKTAEYLLSHPSDAKVTASVDSSLRGKLARKKKMGTGRGVGHSHQRSLQSALQ